MSIDVHLDGIFLHNDSYDYGSYVYNEECSPVGREAVLIPLLYSVVLFVGLTGNVLLLVILALKRRSWSVMDIFVFHLSVADILLLVTLPFWATQAAEECGWCSGTFLCKMSGGIFHLNFYCGIFLLVCITVDRYLSIVHSAPILQKNPRFAHISCVAVWLFCLLLTIPDWIFLAVITDEGKTVCAHNYFLFSSQSHGLLGSRLLFHVMGFLLPSVALIYSCVRLQLQYKSQNPRQQRALRVLFILVLAFVFCWLPYNITLIVDTFRSNSVKTALMVVTALSCFHACLRPVIYLSLCRNFRQRTLALLKCVGGPEEESSSSLWEFGVEEKSVPDQGHEKVPLKQTSEAPLQVRSDPC